MVGIQGLTWVSWEGVVIFSISFNIGGSLPLREGVGEGDQNQDWDQKKVSSPLSTKSLVFFPLFERAQRENFDIFSALKQFSKVKLIDFRKKIALRTTNLPSSQQKISLFANQRFQISLKMYRTK